MRRLSLVFAAVLAAFVFSEEASAQGVCFGSNCGSASGSGVPSNIPSGTPTDCTALSVWRTSAGQLLECGLGLTYSNGVIAAGTASTLRGGLDLFGATHAFSTRFQVSESQGAGITYTLPTTDGGASEFLQTNGSGALTWAAVSSSTITSGTTATSGCVAGGVLRSISNLVECGAGITYIAPTFKINSAATGPAQILDLRSTAAAPVHMTMISASNNGYGTFSAVSGTGGPGGDVFGLGYAANLGAPSYPLKWGDFGGVIITGTTAAGVPLTINNSTNAVSPLVVQDNGTAIFTIEDGGLVRIPNMRILDNGGGGLSTNQSNGWTWLTDGDNHNRFYMPYAASSSTINNNFRLEGHRHANTSTGYGTGLLFQGRSTTTADNDMIRVAGVWTDATHASRSAAVVFEAVNGAAALAEVGRFNAVGGLKIAPGTKPTCDATYRGTVFYVAGGAGVADTMEVCAKPATDVYAWYPMATIP